MAQGNVFTQYRDSLLAQYREAGLTGDDYAVVAAMTLGDKTALTREVRETFNTTSGSHVLALSGLHLGIIYLLLTMVVPNHRWRMATQIVTIVAIWAFAMLTGMAPSIVRAAVMLTIYGLLALGYRQKASIRVLLFTAFVMLVFNPRLLFNVSFQLSFAAVGGIVLFMPLMYDALPVRWMQRHAVLRWLWGMVTVSCAAQVAVAPLIAFYFHRLPVWFVLTNFIVVPCAYIIIIGALLLLLTHATLVADGLSATVRLMTGGLEKIATLPAACIDDLYPSGLQVALIYLAIACFYIFFRTFARRNNIRHTR